MNNANIKPAGERIAESFPRNKKVDEAVNYFKKEKERIELEQANLNAYYDEQRDKENLAKDSFLDK